jgi:hypothetical protein
MVIMNHGKLHVTDSWECSINVYSSTSETISDAVVEKKLCLFSLQRLENAEKWVCCWKSNPSKSGLSFQSFLLVYFIDIDQESACWSDGMSTLNMFSTARRGGKPLTCMTYPWAFRLLKPSTRENRNKTYRRRWGFYIYELMMAISYVNETNCLPILGVPHWHSNHSPSFSPIIAPWSFFVFHTLSPSF